MKLLLYGIVLVAYTLTLYKFHKEGGAYEDKVVDNELIYGLQLVAYVSCIYFFMGSHNVMLKHRFPLFLLLTVATVTGLVVVNKNKKEMKNDSLPMNELNQIDTLVSDNSDRKFMDNDFRESLMMDMEREINNTRSGVEKVVAASPSNNLNIDVNKKNASSVNTKELLYISCFILALDIFIFNKQYSMNRYHKGVLKPPSGFMMFLRKVVRLMGVLIPFIDSYFVYYFANQLS